MPLVESYSKVLSYKVLFKFVDLFVFLYSHLKFIIKLGNIFIWFQNIIPSSCFLNEMLGWKLEFKFNKHIFLFHGYIEFVEFKVTARKNRI